MVASLRVRALLLGALPLWGCPSPDTQTPECGVDGGGPVAAVAQFTAYLQMPTSGCNVDADCVLIQTPCGQNFETCDFTQVAVPASVEVAAVELVSKLTAEECPASCTLNASEAPVGGDVDCEIFGTPAAHCVVDVELDGGSCSVGNATVDDGGAGNFESFCDPPCSSAQFCDISGIEEACDAGGVFAVPIGATGVCAPVQVDAGVANSCGNTEACSFGSACVAEDGGFFCRPACPAAAPVCPNGCGPFPLDDGRHCLVCLCDSTCPG